MESFSSIAQTKLAVVHLRKINNESVEWIALGEYQAAFYHLQDGIRLVSGVLSQPNQDEETANLPCTAVETFPRCLDADVHDSEDITSQRCMLRSNILSLPFLISNTPEPVRSNDHCTVQSVASVAIYNMGLSCFFQSHCAMTYVAKERLLDRAFFLFHQAFQLADNATDIFLASCHNLIELCVHRGDLCGAQRWRNRLLTATDSMVNSWGLYQQAARIYHSATFVASRAA